MIFFVSLGYTMVHSKYQRVRYFDWPNFICCNSKKYCDWVIFRSKETAQNIGLRAVSHRVGPNRSHPFTFNITRIAFQTVFRVGIASIQLLLQYKFPIVSNLQVAFGDHLAMMRINGCLSDKISEFMEERTYILLLHLLSDWIFCTSTLLRKNL